MTTKRLFVERPKVTFKNSSIRLPTEMTQCQVTVSIIKKVSTITYKTKAKQDIFYVCFDCVRLLSEEKLLCLLSTSRAAVVVNKCLVEVKLPHSCF